MKKDVQYSISLDVFDLCTAELQKRLIPTREKIKIAEDAKLNRERAKVEDFLCFHLVLSIATINLLLFDV